MASYPSRNDRDFDLLKKMTENTADIASGGGGGGAGPQGATGAQGPQGVSGGAGSPVLLVESGTSEKVSDLPLATTPPNISLVYLSEENGAGGFASKAMEADDFFTYFLSRYRGSSTDSIHIAFPASSTSGIESLTIGGACDGTTRQTLIGYGSDGFFGGFSVAVGTNAKVRGSACISIGRDAQGANFADETCIVQSSPPARAWAAGDTTLNGVLNANKVSGFAAFGTWDFTGLSVTGSLKLPGELLTAAPGGAAARTRFGSVTAGAVSLDTANYWEVMIGGTVKKVLLAS